VANGARIAIGLVVVASLQVACTRQEPSVAGSGYLATASARPEGGPAAASVFADDHVNEYALTVAPAAWAELVANATREEYIPAALTAAGINLGTVGVRFKGSNGSLLTCFQDGRQTCQKAALKIKFDHVDPKQRFFGLKRINLNAFADDRTAMHERLAFELFHQLGIPAPRSAHARVTLNGQLLGLFVAVEEIDGRFTADRWPQEGDGNVYKEIWPGNTLSAAFTPALKTNEERPEHQVFAVLNNLVKTANPHDLSLILDEWLDVDYLMRYLAVDDTIINWDGVRSFYCDDSGVYCGNHNYDWYQDEKKNHFWLIPWDLSQTFHLYDPFWKVPRWNAASVDCSRLGVTPKGTPLRPGACDRVLHTLAEVGRPAYQQARRTLAARWDAMAPAALVDRWARLIEPVITEDVHGPGLPAWRLAIKELKRDLLLMRANIDNDDAPAAEGAETVGLFRNSFEGAARPIFLARTQFSASPRSGVLHDLNREQPLAGTQDVLMQFELANDIVNGAPVPYTQAALLHLPFATGTSLHEARKLRFTWKSDVPRTIAVSLEGARPWRDDLHPRLVQVVETKAGAVDYEIDFAAMTPDTEDPRFDDTARQAILDQPQTLLFQIQAVGTIAGLLPPGRTDVGSVQLDNIVIE
jgi:spore coat protein H